MTSLLNRLLGFSPNRAPTGKRRPRLSLKRLDDRACPSVSVSLIDGHVLRIAGDNTNNHIAILDEGQGNIRVTTQLDSLSTLFSGIDDIQVKTHSGNDFVTVLRESSGEIPAINWSDLHVDLGEGDDTFRLVSPQGTVPTEKRHIALVSVQAGDGNDIVQLDYASPIANPRRFEPNDVIEVNLGRDDDNFSIQLPVSYGVEMPGVLQTGLTVNVEGGSGNDTFHTIANAVFIEDPNLRAAVRSKIQFQYKGGEGNDTFDTALTGISLNATSSFEIDGGVGQDSFTTEFRGVTVNAPVEVTQFGGAGNDDIRVIYGFNPQPDSPARPGLVVNAPLRIQLSGGGGNDDIRVISGFNPQPDPPAIPLLLLNSRMILRLEGGGGNDTLFSEIIPCIRPSGALAEALDGGAGDDVLAASIFVDAQSVAAHDITCHVNGGDGNDRLALAAVEPFEIGPRTDFLIDGGAGIDTVLVSTTNVRIRNCEQ